MKSTLAPWWWRSRPLEHLSGSDVFERLFREEAIATLLESPALSKANPLAHSRYSICAGAPRLRHGELQLWIPNRGRALPFLRSLCNRSLETQQLNSRIEPPSHLPFQGGWLGWLGYGVSWEIETLPQLNPDPLPFPDAYWYEPESFAVLDHQAQLLWLASSTPETLAQLEQKVTTPPPSVVIQSAVSSPTAIEFETTQRDYISRVEKAKGYITQGDIFQANLSLRFSTTCPKDPWEIYRDLHQINPSPFASFWKTPWGGIISCSPERLVQLQGRTAQTRPIAGTRPRNDNPCRNQQWETELKSNRKEQAEHIMLVDLERNDLGRVCEWGSVDVDELCVIEPYSHVIHLVSNVVGRLKPDQSPIDLIQATFPGGTITGCPKVRCMEIIEELEPVQRSLFYGSCGFLDHRGHLDLNILIRTLLYSQPSPKQRTFWGQVGAGIVADSDPQQEWLESLQKAKALFAVLCQEESNIPEETLEPKEANN